MSPLSLFSDASYFRMYSGAFGQEREVGEWGRVVREDLAADRAKQNSGGSSGGRKRRWILGGRGGRKEHQRPGGIEEGAPHGGDCGEESGRGVGGTGGKRGSLASAWVEDLGGYLSLPEVEISSAEEFMGEFVNKSRPAVIKVTRPEWF